jgi:hypothetical protein
MQQRPKSPWAAIGSLVIAVVVLAIGAISVLHIEGPSMWVILVLCGAWVLGSVVWAFKRLRDEHAFVERQAAERSLESKLGPCGTCSRCGHRVRQWFLEQFPKGGTLAVPGEENSEWICRQCTEEWPYHDEQESEEEYVERLKPWIAERKKRIAEEAGS